LLMMEMGRRRLERARSLRFPAAGRARFPSRCRGLASPLDRAECGSMCLAGVRMATCST